MADQDELRAIVKRMIARGDDEDKIALVIQRYNRPTPQTQPLTRTPVAGRGAGSYDVQKSNDWAKRNAPAIGATLGVMAGPAGWVASPAMALLGGTGGAMLEGNEHPVEEGAYQALIELLGNSAQGTGRAGARGLMDATVPKAIRAEFPTVNVAREMVERGALPGVKQSAARIGELSNVANLERTAAAATVPTMPRWKVIDNLRPIYQEQVLAKKPGLAREVMDQMKEIFHEVGAGGSAAYPAGLEGPQQLARKMADQRLGKGALNATSRNQAALGSTVYDAEREAVVGHMRETPRMARALDESQKLMAVDKVMKDAAASGNPLSRMGGGPSNMAKTPVGFGLAAHGVNQASRVFDPNVLRLLQSLMNDRSNDQQE